jgi:hypothetical protein
MLSIPLNIVPRTPAAAHQLHHPQRNYPICFEG